MPSAWATYMDEKARKLLWSTHAETLTVRLDGVTPSTLRGVFKRFSPDAPQEADGAGLTTYTGLAQFVVLRADLTDVTNVARTQIEREGQTWHVTEVEPQDAWTWTLHLSRRNPTRVPRR
jgi:hypothetical protein